MQQTTYIKPVPSTDAPVESGSMDWLYQIATVAAALLLLFTAAG